MFVVYNGLTKEGAAGRKGEHAWAVRCPVWFAQSWGFWSFGCYSGCLALQKCSSKTWGIPNTTHFEIGLSRQRQDLHYFTTCMPLMYRTSQLAMMIWLCEQVAYVLGQLQDKASTEALVSTLKDVREHPMVRHEAAEALGSIAGM